MGKQSRWTSLASLALLLGSGNLGAIELSGDITQGSRLLSLAESPVHVRSTIRVAEDASLKIEAGVELRFAAGACLIVEGEIHALGEKRTPVVFTAEDPEQRWGNLKILGDKDLPAYDGDQLYIPDSGGSRLIHCEFSHGGQVPDNEYDGGALYLLGSAPIVRGCRFADNEAERGGALVCYNFATPLIQDCTFENNRSLLDDGGAIYCFFYSDALIERNFIVQNSSARHGGGIYVSVSNPLIRENAFIDNRADRWGGAMYVSSSSPQILDNAFFEHQADERSTGITLQSDCKPTIRGNSLQTGGVEVLGLNLSYDLDLSENWWGETDEFLLQGKIEQRGRGLERKMNMEPWLDKPVNNLLTQPVEIQSIHVMANNAWSDTLAFDLVDGVVARVQIRAVDRNPYAVDQTSAEVRILERPEERFTLIFRESDKGSGVFRARLSVSREHEDYPELLARVGEHVLFTSSADELVTRLYRVDEARPVIHDLAILSDPDPGHITEHRLRVSWDYFDLLGREQSDIQMQVSQDPAFGGGMIWDSQPQQAAQDLRQLTYGGRDLQDGAKYFVRMRARGEAAWSAWQVFMLRSDNPEFSIRMNSLPAVPALTSPAADAILPVLVPELVAGAVVDSEGDQVGYHFQIAGDPYFQQILHESDAAELQTPRWSPPGQLEDNGYYWWRLRVYDGFEWGDWSSSRGFALNPVEQPPLPFDLVGPEGAIANVLPTFTWLEGQDPDPGARLSYTFLIGGREDLSDAERIPDLDRLSYEKRAEIPNLSTLFWAVEAVDNTGRRTRSRQVMRIDVDTTPSVPVALFPEGDQEIRAEESFRLEASVDPWPEDVVDYEIQVSGDGNFALPLLYWRGLSLEDISSTGLDGYQDSRLLSDDQRYFWRTRAVDNHGAASDWSKVKAFWFNRRNGAPSTPGGDMQPPSGAVIREAPFLSWSPSLDPDHSDPASTLSYIVQLSEREDFPGEVIERVLKAETRLDLTGLIPDNSRWFWRVMARDDENATSGWSATRSLVYNRAEEPPYGLARISPEEGERWVKLDHILLEWTEAKDPDWNASLEYEWRLGLSSDLSTPLSSGLSTKTTARVTAQLNSRNDYWLGLKVMDETGLEQVLPARRIHVDSHPAAPRLIVSGEEYGPATQLEWEAAVDPDPDDKLLYRITLRNEVGAPVVDVADWPSTSATLGRLFGADRLVDDQAYVWTVMATDPHGLSATSVEQVIWFNRRNNAPGAPAFGPELATELVLRRADPTITFIPGEDSDHSDPVSSLRHELQVAASPTFSGARTVRIDPGRSEVGGLGLGDNARWYLRLRAVDDEGEASAWSAPASIVINLEEEPPSSPQWLQPDAGARLYDLRGLDLAFEAATDPDVDAVLHYQLELLEAEGTLVTRVDLAFEEQGRLDVALKNRTSYRLRLKAVDETGLESAASERLFSVDTTPSTVVFGGRSGEVVTPGYKLSWSPATDPDPRDRLVYELQFVTGSGQPELRELSTASLVLTKNEQLPENGEFSVRVRARDPHGITGEWSQALTLIWNAENEAPVWVGELLPAVDIIRDNEPEIRWQLPADPDPGDQGLVVELQVAGDPGFNELLDSKRVAADLGGVRQKLRENEARWLRARAVDASGAASDWSPVRAYLVNAREERPEGVVLYEPRHNSVTEPGQIRFRWSDSSDPDPGDRLHYTLVLDGPRGREELQLDGTETTVPLEAGEWSWSVQAVDSSGLTSPAASAKLKVQAPSAPRP